MSNSPQLGRMSVTRKVGSERFRAGAQDLGFDLQSFWRWYVSDLVSNATRGCLAEYIVAQALDADPCGIRDEWAACDLRTPDGVKVEVKSSAFVQSWHQRDFSPVKFMTPKTRAWDPDTNKLAAEPCRQADVYVFALLEHKDKSTIEPMDVSQWRFFVVATSALNARTRSQHSITLKSLETLAGRGVTYAGLRDAVTQAARTHRDATAK